jgi:hypothetical protein
MLIVQNGKKYGFIGKNRLYIGRANPSFNLSESPLANPFVLGRDGDRCEVIEKFRQWLWPQLKLWRDTGELTEATQALKAIAVDVDEGKLVVLTCWCKPEACHGDVIVSCVNWIIQEGMV